MDYTPTNEGLAVVFVGCGGTYWTSANYLCSLLRQMSPSQIDFVDPARLEERNRGRQWCQVGTRRTKAGVAREKFTPPGLFGHAVTSACTFQEWMVDPERLIKRDVLVIVNVDNDEARLAVRQWCLERLGRTLMVMSGCDMNYGQVYYGVYEDGGARHDWLPFHLEVVDPKVEPIHGGTGGCGAQSTMSNFMTGALFGPAILEAIRWWTPAPPPKVSEFYWSRRVAYDEPKEDGTLHNAALPHILKMWSQLVEPEVVEVEEVL